MKQVAYKKTFIDSYNREHELTDKHLSLMNKNDLVELALEIAEEAGSLKQRNKQLLEGL